MRFDLDNADWVPEEVKDAIRRLVRVAITGMHQQYCMTRAWIKLLNCN
jgi:hypothetical protein